MANLSAAEITKAGREYRAEIIIKKMNEGSAFELSSGKKIVFKKSAQVIAILNKKTKSSADLNAIRFVGSDGKQYKLSDIKKNAEFGGKGDRSSVAKEDAALSSINSQLNAIKKATALAYVPVKVKSTIHKVVKAESTPGTPKSDFHLINEAGEECVWISHKDGSTAKDFQQWGGISERKEPLIFAHKETQKFVADLKAVYPKGLPSATTLYRHIKDDHLKMLSVYGNSYGGTLGKQNVSVLLQGPPEIKVSGKNYVLSANHVHYNGDSVDGDGFDPVLMAIYKGDRSDAGVKGTRIVISPVGGRKGAPF